MRCNPIWRPAGIPLAGVISAGVAVALAVSGCGSGHAKAGSAAGGAPSFSPVPAASASAAPVAGALPKGVLASIPVDSASGLGFGFGSVWVASHRSNQLNRIDPATGKIIATIDTGMASSCGTVGVGFGRVWVNGCDDVPETVVVDPATNQVVGRFPHFGLSVGFGAGSAWIASGPSNAHSLIYRVNPKTLAVQARIKAGGGFVVFGGGSVWVANELTGTVARIDPATNTVIATIPAGMPGADGTSVLFAAGKLFIYPGFQSPLAPEQAGGRIWLINPHGDSVTERTIAGLPGGFNTGQIWVGMNSVWVRGYGTPVFRYDARTFRFVGKYPADHSAIGFVGTGFGSLWVANMDTSTLWRDRITG